MENKWIYSEDNINWEELSELYRIAPLGNKTPEWLNGVYTNSLFKCFVYDNNKIIAAGRALADGADCSYLCDIVVHPDWQRKGLGKQFVNKLVKLSKGHRKIILFANPGKEEFYEKLGFLKMKTAMAIFENQDSAVKNGLLEKPE